MKKSIVFFLFIACQFAFGQNFSVGPIVGLNYSNFRGDINNNSGKLGFAGGIFANYSITDEFGLTGQVLYSQQGTKLESMGIEDTWKFDYLQVPILGAYYFGKDKFKPKVLLGPQFGFLLSTKDKDGRELADSDILETTDISAVLGAGFNYNLAPKIWLNVDVRYNLGLMDIHKLPDVKLYNSNLALMVGVSIGFRDYDMKSGSFSKTKK
ncbi:MAG: PorT family protein [Raineya sp.]|jgi:outer membrane protein W|nr:PorT family protein [Raineya sp.]